MSGSPGTRWAAPRRPPAARRRPRRGGAGAREAQDVLVVPCQRGQGDILAVAASHAEVAPAVDDELDATAAAAAAAAAAGRHAGGEVLERLPQEDVPPTGDQSHCRATRAEASDVAQAVATLAPEGIGLQPRGHALTPQKVPALPEELVRTIHRPLEAHIMQARPLRECEEGGQLLQLGEALQLALANAHLGQPQEAKHELEGHAVPEEEDRGLYPREGQRRGRGDDAWPRGRGIGRGRRSGLDGGEGGGAHKADAVRRHSAVAPFLGADPIQQRLGVRGPAPEYAVGDLLFGTLVPDEHIGVAPRGEERRLLLDDLDQARVGAAIHEHSRPLTFARSPPEEALQRALGVLHHKLRLQQLRSQARRRSHGRGASGGRGGGAHIFKVCTGADQDALPTLAAAPLPNHGGAGKQVVAERHKWTRT
mmetsp:Transcript_53783/g.139065  ORF Transcript_53783/g.139065 Transcript_53783/m.139065 type:complete len:423 (+) Transcript_53783:796-2064(+)